jgi:hypothetical protein
VSRARFEKPCAAVPARAIERAVRLLLQQGYAVEEQAGGQASLVFVRGSVTAARLDRHRHHLELTSDGKSLFFDFHSGLGGSGYLTKNERHALEERADAVAAAARDADPPPPAPAAPEAQTFRCRYCGALTPIEKPGCSSCGADNFV